MKPEDRPELRANSAGTLLPVRALSGSRSTEIRGWENGRLKISVTQVAEKGKANTAIQTLLATRLHISKSKVQLVAGETSRDKVFLLCGVEPHSVDVAD